MALISGLARPASGPRRAPAMAFSHPPAQRAHFHTSLESSSNWCLAACNVPERQPPPHDASQPHLSPECTCVGQVSFLLNLPTHAPRLAARLNPPQPRCEAPCPSWDIRIIARLAHMPCADPSPLAAHPPQPRPFRFFWLGPRVALSSCPPDHPAPAPDGVMARPGVRDSKCSLAPRGVTTAGSLPARGARGHHPVHTEHFRAADERAQICDPAPDQASKEQRLALLFGIAKCILVA